MKFVADEMLGKLAKWLRIMGIDVEYENPFPDDLLLKKGTKENRVILTRDRKILNKKNLPECVLIEDDYPYDQLIYLLRRYDIAPLERAFSRCIGCNCELKDISREEIEGRVPPYVFATQKEYRICPGCGKVYWAGTHRERMEAMLKELKEKTRHFTAEK